MTSSLNPLAGFTVAREQIQYVGSGLQRPECVLAEPDGTLWAADARGGVTRIAADGSQAFIGQKDARFTTADTGSAAALAEKFTTGTLPNGLAFDTDGSLLIANFGTDRLERMQRDGTTEVLCDAVEGQPIGKVNFVLRDRKGRIWVTVSTRVNPWTQAAASRICDGYIAVLEQGRLRVVADGFYFANELRLDADEQWLYVAETTGPYISRLRVEDGPQGVRLGRREIVGPSDLGGFPDGIAFDAYGNLWCTLVMVDQLIAITPEGERLLLLDDGDPAASQALRAAMQAGTVSDEVMLNARGTVAPWMASITFGGPDLRTVYLGSLMGERLPAFRSPVAGLPLAHWPSGAR